MGCPFLTEVDMSDKTDAEVAVEAFETAHSVYKLMEEEFLSGEYLRDIHADDPSTMVENHQRYLERMKQALEERNARRKTAADTLRASVSLTNTQTRGPDGKPTVNKVGQFWVSSVTKRSFHPGDLQRMCSRYPGLWETILNETSRDKDGKEYRIVNPTLEVDYEKVLLWLKANGYQDVINVAYDEREGTPMVKGPKSISFLGDEKKD